MDIEARSTTTPATAPPSFLARNRRWLCYVCSIVLITIVVFSLYIPINSHLRSYKPKIKLEGIVTDSMFPPGHDELNYTDVRTIFSFKNPGRTSIMYSHIMVVMNYNWEHIYVQVIAPFSQKRKSVTQNTARFVKVPVERNNTSAKIRLSLTVKFEVEGFVRSHFSHCTAWEYTCHNVKVVGGSFAVYDDDCQLNVENEF